MKGTKPIHEVRLGRIKAAVFVNQTVAGIRHNVVFSRIYKKNDKWERSESFGSNDLPVLTKVFDLVQTWLGQQKDQPVVSEQQPS